MINCNLIFGLLIILLPLHVNQVRADDWDISKVNSSDSANQIQKWCKSDGTLARYSNTKVKDLEPCGEVKTQVSCNASGRKMIGSAPPPYGYKECSSTPRIYIERIGPQIVEQELESAGSISLARNDSTDSSNLITSGLKSYQNYMDNLDQLTDEKPKPRIKKEKATPSGLGSLTSSISPEMIVEVMKTLSQLSN